MCKIEEMEKYFHTINSTLETKLQLFMARAGLEFKKVSPSTTFKFLATSRRPIVDEISIRNTNVPTTKPCIFSEADEVNDRRPTNILFSLK